MTEDKKPNVDVLGGLKKYKPVHHLLSSEGYSPASGTREHDCKIPLLFLDVKITEPRLLLLFDQQNSC